MYVSMCMQCRQDEFIRKHLSSKVKVLVGVTLFNVAGLSLIGHKEHRFLLAALPTLHLIVGALYHHLDTRGASTYKRGTVYLLVTAVVHFGAAFYLGYYHQVIYNLLLEWIV
jgi:hypothetical protein